MDWRRELDSILTESKGSANLRESSAFDEAAGPHGDSIVLVGAGNLGRRVLRGLRAVGKDVIAFADSNPKLWNNSVSGVPVLSPESAARKFGHSSVFIVCIWHPEREQGVQQHISRMVDFGAPRAVPFVWLFWKYPDVFLPYYLWDLPSKIPAQREEIAAACAELATDCDRITFVSHLALRSRADFSRQPAPAPTPSYFPADLFRVGNLEHFVDCGAFDGDTIQLFLDASKRDFARISAFESDPTSLSALERFVDSNEFVRSRTMVHRKAVSSTSGTLRFTATGQANAAISDRGELDVECTTLDEALGGEQPTFIKMDIEGAEFDALQGARNIITRHKPVLAVCIYHRQEDLWRIPLLMRELQPESQLSLRSYWLDGFDLVCYAVPKHRQLNTRVSR